MISSVFFLVPLVVVSLLATSAQALTAPTPSKVLALNYECTVIPEKQDLWLSNILDNQKCTCTLEKGNLQFVVGQDVDNENKFYLHEEFADQDAFMEHVASKHFDQYDAFCKAEEPFAKEPVICFYHPLEEEVTEKRSTYKGSFGLNVNLYPKAEVREEFLKVISNNKKQTKSTEPLALQYTYGESTSALGMEAVANTFHFHEQYTGKDHSREGLDAHASAPHFALWEKFVGTDPFTKTPKVAFFRILED